MRCARKIAALNCTESTGRSAGRYAWDDVVRAISRSAEIRRGSLRKMQRANEHRDETLRRGRRRVLESNVRRLGSAEQQAKAVLRVETCVP